MSTMSLSVESDTLRDALNVTLSGGSLLIDEAMELSCTSASAKTLAAVSSLPSAL